MAGPGSRSENALRKLWDALWDWVEGKVPQESSLRTDAERMLEAASAHADAASLSMALADQKREELAREIANYEALGHNAAELLGQNDETGAERCAALRAISARKMALLEQEYTGLQTRAEQAAATFVNEKAEVDRRVEQLPQLQADAQMVRLTERALSLTEQLSLLEAKSSFDRSSRELEVRKLQVANRGLLTGNAHAAVDARIRQQLEAGSIEREMLKIRELAARQPKDAEFEVLDEDSAARARKLLERPRYEGILRLPSRTETRERVPVRPKDGT